MSRKSRNFVVFAISFVIAFFIVGYIRNTMFVAIHWVEGVTAWDKFREYYIRTFAYNIIPSLIIAAISTLIINYANLNRILKLWIFCMIALIIVLFAFLGYYVERNAALERDIKSAKENILGKEQTNAALQKEIEDLRNELIDSQSNRPQLPHSDEIILNELWHTGFKGQIKDITADLAKHPELIPYKGVLGGTMAYVDMRVLSDKWVLAYMEDGHINAYMLLTYKWNGSDFDWKVVSSYMPGAE